MRIEPVLALTGPSGVGKSQMALAFASQSSYQLVWWIRGDTPEVFEAGCAALGQRLQAAEPTTRPAADELASARAWLRENNNWLLIVDHAPDPAVVLPMLPQGEGHVLITTRTQFPEPGAKNFPIPVLDAQAATEFLLHRTGASDTAGAGRVAAALGFHPLALELAGAFVEQYGTFAGYMKLLMARDPGLAEFDPERAVAAACRISLERVRALSPAATELLWLCAFLAPEEIPMDSLATSIRTQSPALRKAVATNRLDEAVGVLWRLSLLERQNFGVWMHHLVQQVARAELPPAEQRVWATAAVDSLRAAFPDDPADAVARTEAERLLAHLFAAAELARGLGVEPAATSGLYHHVGRYHRSRAELIRAQASLELSLASSEAAYGPNHPSLAAPLNDLGGVLRDLAQLTAAQACFERALAINEAALSPSHLDVAVSASNLAQVLHDLGDLAGARAGFERAVAIDVATYGPDHPVVGHVVNDMAGVLRDQGDLDGARAWYERAVAIDEAAYGPDHLVVADVVKRLAGVQRDLGELPASRAGFERALAIEEAAYGPAHPAVAGLVNNLAVVLRDQGDLTGAKAGFERALAIEEATYGPDHPEVALVVDNLALALQDLGDLEGARAGFERALAIDEACHGRHHADASLVADHLTALIRLLDPSFGEAPDGGEYAPAAGVDLITEPEPGVGDVTALVEVVEPAAEAVAPVEVVAPVVEAAVSIEVVEPPAETLAPVETVEAAIDLEPSAEAEVPVEVVEPVAVAPVDVEVVEAPSPVEATADLEAGLEAAASVEVVEPVEAAAPAKLEPAGDVEPSVEAAAPVGLVEPAVEAATPAEVDVIEPAAEVVAPLEVVEPAVEAAAPAEVLVVEPAAEAAAPAEVEVVEPAAEAATPVEVVKPAAEGVVAVDVGEPVAEVAEPEVVWLYQRRASGVEAEADVAEVAAAAEGEPAAQDEVVDRPAGPEPTPDAVAGVATDEAAIAMARIRAYARDIEAARAVPPAEAAPAVDDRGAPEQSQDDVAVIEQVVELARMLERLAEAPPRVGVTEPPRKRVESAGPPPGDPAEMTGPSLLGETVEMSPPPRHEMVDMSTPPRRATVEMTGPPRRVVPLIIDAASFELNKRERVIEPAPAIEEPEPSVQAAGAVSRPGQRPSGYRLRRRVRGRS